MSTVNKQMSRRSSTNEVKSNSPNSGMSLNLNSIMSPMKDANAKSEEVAKAEEADKAKAEGEAAKAKAKAEEAAKAKAEKEEAKKLERLALLQRVKPKPTSSTSANSKPSSNTNMQPSSNVGSNTRVTNPNNITEESKINIKAIYNVLIEILKQYITILTIYYDLKSCSEYQIPLYYHAQSGYCSCIGCGKSCKDDILSLNRGKIGDSTRPIFGAFSEKHTGLLKYKKNLLNMFANVISNSNTVDIIFMIIGKGNDIQINTDIANIAKIIPKLKNIIDNPIDYLKDVVINQQSYERLINNIIPLVLNVYYILYNVNLFSITNVNFKTLNNEICMGADIYLLIAGQFSTRFNMQIADILNYLTRISNSNSNNELVTYFTELKSLVANTLKLLQIDYYGVKHDFYYIKSKNVCNNLFDDKCEQYYGSDTSGLNRKRNLTNKSIKTANDTQSTCTSDLKAYEFDDTKLTSLNKLFDTFVEYSTFINDLNHLFLIKFDDETDYNTNKDSISRFNNIVDAIAFIRTYTANFTAEYGQKSTSDLIAKKKQEVENQRKKPVTNKIKGKLRNIFNRMTKKKGIVSPMSNSQSTNNKSQEFKNQENTHNTTLYELVLPKIWNLCAEYKTMIDTCMAHAMPKMRNSNNKLLALRTMNEQQKADIEEDYEYSKLLDTYNELYDKLPKHKLIGNENVIDNNTIPDIKQTIKLFIEVIDLAYQFYSLNEKCKLNTSQKVGVSKIKTLTESRVSSNLKSSTNA